mmetsp:Transcript_54942/g.117922  ORF Transcript_54942/g.117922 Transcript_54942/m.117922 type:complete len:248 (-) Transcript_54942:33-776(-)
MSVDCGTEPPFPPSSPAEVAELTEEAQDKQNGLKQESAEALEDGKLDAALEKLNDAIAVGCASAMLISKRAQLLMKLDRPRAAANDCTEALKINPDSGKAFKIRARAYRKIEMWEEAHADFQTGLKIDYDEETYDESLEVAARVKEAKTAATAKRVQDEAEEYQKKLAESKAAYEAGMQANEERFREQRMKEEEEKKQKEDERKERVRRRQQEEGGGEAPAADEPGVPKAHTPAEPAPATAAAEEVD